MLGEPVSFLLVGSGIFLGTIGFVNEVLFFRELRMELIICHKVHVRCSVCVVSPLCFGFNDVDWAVLSAGCGLSKFVCDGFDGIVAAVDGFSAVVL